MEILSLLWCSLSRRTFNSGARNLLLATLLIFIGQYLEALAPAETTALSLPATIAIQKRPYLLKSEFSGHISYLPMDYFTTYLAAGGAYTHYFSDYFGWEVLNANYASDSSTGLEAFVRKSGAVPEGLDVMSWYVTSNLVYTPMYMKNLLMQDRVVWGDISFVGGYGLANFRTAKNVGTLDGGVMLRFFSTEKLAIKFDLRQYFYLAGGLRPNMGITIGLSYNFANNESSPVVVEEE